jgi:RNA-directed DNA polymerase
VFAGEVKGNDGKRRIARLAQAADTKIVRHAKIRTAANPYDPTWEDYFEARLGVQMARTLRGRRQLLHVWKEQDRRCPVCGHAITRLTGWHTHHLTWRSRGGSDTAANRVLLHPACHRQAHALGLTVVKPRAAHPARS